MSISLTRRKVIIAGVGAMLTAFVPIANAEPVGIPGFKKHARQQLTPVWCWAAVIQTLLDYRGIEWSQPEIVAAMKGHVTIETATDYEMSAFLNSWGFTHKGIPWRSSAKFSNGSPSPELTVSELRDKRPIILKLRLSPTMDHVVIAYVANVLARPGQHDQLNSVYYIDPADGDIHLLTGKQYVSKVVGHWLVDIESA
ncbi:hypothetical protein LOY35_27520 [Pseudomonas sp. B21-028]|uniref:papain-like cysteine protease family protein n=1 Tax=Pseudomonas sp. B21-028 TaxID=2895480 RepID=UPI00215F0595|nr:papain-like cysteine protease family protein [Pseudomonas sp. B21-028]UVL83865.1 hypothetical protein LOY35_27520 [Pseudomonas sp. B21-028]